MNIIQKCSYEIQNDFLGIDNKYLFYDTTWLDINDDSRIFIDANKHKTFLMYSGMDWHNEQCRPTAWKYFEDIETVPIGNYNTENYFSFWLKFTKEHLPILECNGDNISKHFMCLNRKLHPHRIFLLENLYKYDLFRYRLVSVGTPDEYSAPTILPTPITLDNDIVNSEGDDATTPNVITNDISSYGHMQNWQQHFLNVVTETVVHTDVFISEKTIKPIAGGRPFIILGDDTIYQKLQTWGIDTFDDLFGTGYNLQWYEQRADWIREVLSNLIHTPPPDLQKLYKSLIPRLKNNQERLKEAQIQNEHMIKKVANRFSC